MNSQQKHKRRIAYKQRKKEATKAKREGRYVVMVEYPMTTYAPPCYKQSEVWKARFVAAFHKEQDAIAYKESREKHDNFHKFYIRDRQCSSTS